MSSNAFSKSLRLRLKSNKDLQIMIMGIHSLVAAMLIFMMYTQPEILVCSLIIIISSYFYFYRWHIALILKKSILEIFINASGDFSILTASAGYEQVTLLESSFSSDILIILNFSSLDSKKYTALITRGMLNNNEFRRLKIRLKINQSRIP